MNRNQLKLKKKSTPNGKTSDASSTSPSSIERYNALMIDTRPIDMLDVDAGNRINGRPNQEHCDNLQTAISSGTPDRRTSLPPNYHMNGRVSPSPSKAADLMTAREQRSTPVSPLGRANSNSDSTSSKTVGVKTKAERSTVSNNSNNSSPSNSHSDFQLKGRKFVGHSDKAEKEKTGRGEKVVPYVTKVHRQLRACSSQSEEYAAPGELPKTAYNQASETSLTVRRGRHKDQQIKKTFGDFAKLCNSLTLTEMSKQFDSLPKPDARQCAVGNDSRNAVFNRYTDIGCLDATRVRLHFISDELEYDYIHANLVHHSTLKNNFILTQGPLSRTVSDFWRLVWQERPPFIFMLCRHIEDNRKKSAMYLPSATQPLVLYAGQHYEMTIELKEIRYEKAKNLVYRKVSVSYKGQHFVLTHCQWKGWPDCTAPHFRDDVIFTLLNMYRNGNGPTIVHCSAGIGRSGTIVAIEMCLMKIANGKVPRMVDIVRTLRSKRAQSVQSFEQFSFIYRSVLQFAINNQMLQMREIDRFAKLYDAMLVPSGGSTSSQQSESVEEN